MAPFPKPPGPVVYRRSGFATQVAPAIKQTKILWGGVCFDRALTKKAALRRIRKFEAIPPLFLRQEMTKMGYTWP